MKIWCTNCIMYEIKIMIIIMLFTDMYARMMLNFSLLILQEECIKLLFIVTYCSNIIFISLSIIINPPPFFSSFLVMSQCFQLNFLILFFNFFVMFLSRQIFSFCVRILSSSIALVYALYSTLLIYFSYIHIIIMYYVQNLEH